VLVSWQGALQLYPLPAVIHLVCQPCTRVLVIDSGLPPWEVSRPDLGQGVTLVSCCV
jgi:hypothetical protein